MSGSRTASNPQGNSANQRELVFCYECSNEFYKDGPTGLTCPDCGSDFVQIIEPDFDPRDEDRSDLQSHNPWPDDPPEEDFESFFNDNFQNSSLNTSLHPANFPSSTWRTSNPPNQTGPPNNFPPQVLGNPLLGSFASMIQGMQSRSNPPWPPFGALSQPQQQSTRSQSDPSSSPAQTYTASGPGWTFQTTVTSGGGSLGFGRENGQLDPGDPYALMRGMIRQMEDMGGPFGASMPARNRATQTDPPQHPLANLFNVLLNPANAMSGDAVFSQEAFDRVMSQLMEEHTTGSAPGPASEAAITALPRKTMTESMMDETTKTAECSICMEQVEVGTEIATLPCTHWFHFECVESWLKEHDTCPVCRRGIMPKDGDRDTARSPTQEPLHDEDPFLLARQQSGTREHPFVVPESPSMDRRRPNPRRQSNSEPRSTSRRSSTQNSTNERNEGGSLSGRMRSFFGGGGNGSAEGSSNTRR